jgi:hypothetical protein
MRKDQFPFCKNRCGNRCPALKRKYCSIQCHHQHDFKLRSKLLDLGLYPVSMSTKFLRRYLVAKFGERCTRCGWSERHPKTKRVPIEVEHIDGNFENVDTDNLTLLCPNCHSLTQTYRALNRGSGRAKRLGGRENPLRIGLPKNKVLVNSEAPFPLPRRLVEAVEAFEPHLPLEKPT